MAAASPHDLASVYDAFAATYDANRGRFDMTEILEDFYARLDPAPGALLDLGCGAGEPFATTFLQRGWSVVGVDFSAAMLRLARRYAPAMQGIHGDMRQVGFEPGRFDAVTIIYALFHLPSGDHAPMLSKVHDWLKPGGRVLFTYAGKDYTGHETFDGYKEFLGRQLYYGHKTPEALRRVLDDVGFELEAAHYRDVGGERFLWITARKPVA